MDTFQALIREVETNYRPRCKFSELSDEVLIILLVLADCLGIQCAARILAAAMPTWPGREILRNSRLLAFNPSENNLAWLSKRYPHEEPLRFLLELRRNAHDINREMLRRSADHKLGRAMLVALGTKVEKPLKEQLLKSRDGGRTLERRTWSRDKDGQNDREAAAIEGAWAAFEKLMAKAIRGVKGNYLPALPESINVPPAPAWLVNNLVAEFKDKLDEALRHLKPVLDGKAERIAKSAHQAIKNIDEKGSAQKRAGKMPRVICPECELEFTPTKAPKTCRRCGSKLPDPEPRIKEVRPKEVSDKEVSDLEPKSGLQRRSEGTWSCDSEGEQILLEMGLGEPEPNYFLELIREYRNDENCPADHREILEMWYENDGVKQDIAKKKNITRPTLDARLKEIAEAVLLRKKQTLIAR